jgi:hypothetical protein
MVIKVGLIVAANLNQGKVRESLSSVPSLHWLPGVACTSATGGAGFRGVARSLPGIAPRPVCWLSAKVQLVTRKCTDAPHGPVLPRRTGPSSRTAARSSLHEQLNASETGFGLISNRIAGEALWLAVRRRGRPGQFLGAGLAVQAAHLAQVPMKTALAFARAA